ncbi:phosphoglycerate mutase family protein [bacterium]|nr:phosphoglycerate mutase family protein [bacterium]
MSRGAPTGIAAEALGVGEGSFGRLSERAAGPETVESVCARCERMRLERDVRRQRSERGLPPARNVRGFERIQMGCNPPTFGESIRVRILFMRHGESCANLWASAKFLGRLRKTQYKDPELTRRGQVLAAQQGRTVAERYAAAGVRPIICSSQLFRAIQTADAIPIPGKIFVLPFIQESGAGLDNEAFQPAERARYPELRAKLACLAHGEPDYQFFERATRGAEPNVSAFLRWIQCNVKNLSTAAGQPAGNTVDLVVVTHSNFLKSLQSFLTRLPGRSRMPIHKFNNLDTMDVELNVRLDGTSLIRVGEIERFVPVPDVAVAPDNCRFPVYGRGTAYCARDVIGGAAAVAAAAPTPTPTPTPTPPPPSSGLNTGYVQIPGTARSRTPSAERSPILSEAASVNTSPNNRLVIAGLPNNASPAVAALEGDTGYYLEGGRQRRRTIRRQRQRAGRGPVRKRLTARRGRRPSRRRTTQRQRR